MSPRSSPPPQSLIPTVASRSQPAFTLYQNFLQQLASFRKHLDALGGPVGCALVALVAPRGQLRQPQRLIWELSCCEVLQGCPKVFLLLSSGPEGEWPGRGTWLWGGQRGGGGRPELHCRLVLLHPAAPESGPFLTSLRELCGRCPHWSLLQLLTEVGALGPLHWLAGAFPPIRSAHVVSASKPCPPSPPEHQPVCAVPPRLSMVPSLPSLCILWLLLLPTSAPTLAVDICRTHGARARSDSLGGG